VDNGTCSLLNKMGSPKSGIWKEKKIIFCKGE
jgi:hypothetical protein